MTSEIFQVGYRLGPAARNRNTSGAPAYRIRRGLDVIEIDDLFTSIVWICAQGLYDPRAHSQFGMTQLRARILALGAGDLDDADDMQLAEREIADSVAKLRAQGLLLVLDEGGYAEAARTHRLIPLMVGVGISPRGRSELVGYGTQAMTEIMYRAALLWTEANHFVSLADFADAIVAQLDPPEPREVIVARIFQDARMLIAAGAAVLDRVPDRMNRFAASAAGEQTGESARTPTTL